MIFSWLVVKEYLTYFSQIFMMRKCIGYIYLYAIFCYQKCQARGAITCSQFSKLNQTFNKSTLKTTRCFLLSKYLPLFFLLQNQGQ